VLDRPVTTSPPDPLTERSRTVNVDRMQRIIRRAGVSVLLAMSLENFRYVSGASLEVQRYITERIGIALWPESGAPALIVRNGELSRVVEESWVRDVRPYYEFGSSPMQVLAELLREKGLERGCIAIEKGFLIARFYEQLVSLLPGARIVDAGPLLDEVKVVKTEAELALMRPAWLATERSVAVAYQSARPGDRELDVAATIRSELTRSGAETVPFLLLGSGARSCHIHPTPGPGRLEVGETIRADFGGLFNGYVTDLGRMASIGLPSDKQRDTYRRLIEVHREVIALLRPGVAVRDVYQHATRRLEALGLALDKDHVGHSIGTAVHERPFLAPHEDTIIEPNMVFTVEPSYTEPGVARYHVEDLVLVTAHGPEQITGRDLTDQLLVVV
jgi:Xaa-Pro aminopeptidase